MSLRHRFLSIVLFSGTVWFSDYDKRWSQSFRVRMGLCNQLSKVITGEVLDLMLASVNTSIHENVRKQYWSKESASISQTPGRLAELSAKMQTQYLSDEACNKFRTLHLPRSNTYHAWGLQNCFFWFKQFHQIDNYTVNNS